MKKIILLLFLISIPLAQALELGKAYIVSSININSTGNIEAGQSYSLVPQIVVATGSENYAGSVTPFTGCYGGKRYEKGSETGNCLTGVVNSLNSDSTTDALSAAQGKVLNDKISSLQSATTTNLMNLQIASYDTNGLTITDNQDGTFTINGTSTSESALIDLYDYFDLSIFQKGITYKYFLANELVDGTLIQIWVYSNGEWAMFKSSSTEILFQIQDNWSVIKFRYLIGANKTFNNTIVKPMITSNLEATSQNYSPNPLYNIPKILQIESCYDGVTINYQFVLKYQNREFGIIYFTAAQDIPRWNHIFKGFGPGTQRDFYEQTGTYTFQRHKTNTIQTGYGGLPAGSYVITF